MDEGMPRRLYVNGNGRKNVFGFFLEQGNPSTGLKAKNKSDAGQGRSGIPSMQLVADSPNHPIKA